VVERGANVYLQQVASLKHTMPAEKFTLFSDYGYFTIRRSNEFWAGNFSDQTTEQFLMIFCILIMLLP